MAKVFEASLEWVPENLGGRKMIPSFGTRYNPLIRIDGAKSALDWSIDFICPQEKEQVDIQFSFVSEQAPMDMLKKGGSYGIYEGNKKVAILIIK